MLEHNARAGMKPCPRIELESMAIFKRVTVFQYSCCRCGHGWNPRKGVVPVRCGSCKSPYWNVPIKGAAVPETAEFKEV